MRYDLPERGNVTIKIYTIRGELVKTLVDNEERSEGANFAYWYGKNIDDEVVASGIYLVRIEAPGFNIIRKVCVVK